MKSKAKFRWIFSFRYGRITIGFAGTTFETINNKLRIYRKPEAPSLQYDKTEILSQDNMDRIVNEMLSDH